ncbi:MAG: flippase [Ktedonobacteraceae bacterium]
MNKLRKVVGNTVISLLGQGVTWTSTLLLTIAYGRFLGDVKFGELYFAITFVLLIGFPIEFGFNQQLTRDVAQDPSKALGYLSNILIIKVILWSILYTCMLAICWLLGYSVEQRMLIALCGITLLSGSIANAFGALHYAFERVAYPTIGTTLEKGLSAVVGILALKYGASVEVMACILMGGSLINACWQAIWAFRLLGLHLSVDIILIKGLLLTGIPFLTYGVLGVIYYRIDTVLLSLMTSTAVVGWYGASYRIFDTLVFLPSLVISAIMYPVFSKLSMHSLSQLRIAVEKSLNFLLFLGIPITVGLIVAAPAIIGFLYHRPEFEHSVPALQALAPGLLFLYINSVLSSTLISTKREKKIMLMAAIALIFNLGLNLLLIPRYLQVGAAVVTSLTELLLISLAVFFTPRSLLPLGSIRVGAKALAASLVMAAIIWMMRTVNLLLILPVAMAVYFTTAMLLATIPRDDVRALYGSIRNKSQEAPTNAPEEGTHQEAVEEEDAILYDGDAELAAEFNTPWRLEWTNPNMSAVGNPTSDIPNDDDEMDEATLPRVGVVESPGPDEVIAKDESQKQQGATQLNEDLVQTRRLPRRKSPGSPVRFPEELIPTRRLPRRKSPGSPPVSTEPLPQEGRQQEKADEVIT